MPVYPSPADNPLCQCRDNPLRATLCRSGHVGECHFPHPCEHAGCAHLPLRGREPAELSVLRAAALHRIAAGKLPPYQLREDGRLLVVPATLPVAPATSVETPPLPPLETLAGKPWADVLAHIPERADQECEAAFLRLEHLWRDKADYEAMLAPLWALVLRPTPPRTAEVMEFLDLHPGAAVPPPSPGVDVEILALYVEHLRRQWLLRR